MRPIALSLTAFGPFAGRQVIDFRAALDGRLFGIYGPTGAGKTSILDGICFALFGESSGKERQGTDLRSHHASPDLETEVRLIFDLGPRRYHVVRRPEQVGSAKRGGGSARRPHYAALYDATGIAVEEVTLENPGTVLAERKVEAVADRLTQLLGYKADQFRQVVLLPQGQFRKLLTANSNERAVVLRGLFDVSLYQRFVDQLKSNAGELKAQIEAAGNNIRGRLAAHSASDLTELQVMLKSAEVEHTSLAAELLAANGARELARTTLEAARGVERLFVERDAALKASSDLAVHAPEIERARLRAVAANAAKACRAQQRTLQDATDDLAQALAAENALSETLEAANATYSAALTALHASVARAPERLSAKSMVTALESYSDRLEMAAPLRHALSEAGLRLSGAKSDLEMAEALAAQAAKAVDAAEKGVAAAQSAREQLQQALLKDAGLEGEEKAAHEHERRAAEVVRLRTALRSAQSRRLETKQRVDQTITLEAAAETAMAAAQAVHLARRLGPGEPCPVCGSLKHPNPANEGPGGEGLDHAWRLARAARLAAEEEDRVAADALGVATGAEQLAREGFEGLPTPARASEQVASERTTLSQLIATLTPGADVANRQAAAATARENKAAADAELKRLTDVHGEARTQREAVAAQLAGMLTDLPEDLRTPEVLERKLLAARVHAQGLIAAHDIIVGAEREADTARNTADGHLKAAQALTAERTARAQRAEEEFAQALQEVGITREAFDAAVPDIPLLADLQARIETFDSEQVATSERVARATKAVGAQTRPDLDMLAALADEADASVSSLDRALAERKAQIDAFAASVRDVTSWETRAAEATAQYSRVGALAELTDGRNAQRLRLQDYAISATFEAVLEAANQRFSQMSQNRFTLMRKQEVGDARARSGLDIAIYDGHTDQTRDAHTLSGGEGFLASLSLALGLSDVVQQEAGGVRLDTIFIDEGFGHLDDETLDLALIALRDLVGAERAVGVISHVEAVKLQIPIGFDVRATMTGSAVAPRLGA